ncbi:MAG: right-handed parallel beta-helix repeat-containing protein [Saprospiraceae bacterium]|nr:right-handed parallel beta-helix repeat-containing protein [Saprospiraceae bacterium]
MNPFLSARKLTAIAYVIIVALQLYTHLGSNANGHDLLSVVIELPGASNDCDCTITQVENNAVSPCTTTIGIVDTVSSASGFQTAINTANSTGGFRTILIANGTYQVASTAWYPYITASDIVIRSLSGNRDSVILTGTGMADVSPGTEIGIYAVGDNITIADLTIKEVGNHGVAVTGENLFVHNVRIQDTYEQMIKGNASNGGADSGRVQCSLFEYTAGIGPQWYIGGLDIHNGDDWIVRDNVFKDIESPSAAVAEHAIHFWNSSSNNLVERNVIINCDRGIGFGLGSSPNDGGLIRNNMIYNDGTGVFDDVGIGLETSPNTKVYNNTIFIAYPNAIEYRFPATTNVEITNNLTNKLIKSRDGGTAILITNYTSAADSLFVDVAAGNLRLIEHNPLVVDQGTEIVDVSLDIDQTPRPQGFTYDIGGHEFKCDTLAVNMWIGPGTGNWNDNISNWSLNRLPTFCDQVMIGSGVTVYLSNAESGVAYSVQVASGAQLVVETNGVLSVLSDE